MIRGDILNIATARVCTKTQDYGEPEDNFAKIAKYWSIYLETEIDALDVAHMMLLLKLARAGAVGSTDTYVDMAGYAACAGEIWHGYEKGKIVNDVWHKLEQANGYNQESNDA